MELDDRNHPEDDQVYAWKDPVDPENMPKKWTMPDDYEYPDNHLTLVKNIGYGVTDYFENTWRASFSIGNQTFYLTPVESEESALLYVEMLKIAFNKLMV